MELTLFEFDDSSIKDVIREMVENYQQDRSKLQVISSFVSDQSSLLHYFGGQHERSYMMLEYFNFESAAKKLNAEYWNRVVKMANVVDYMPAKKRNEWGDMIRECKTPEFDYDSVVATIKDLAINRSSFFVEKVEGVFCKLSGKHVTNSPSGFREKLIIDYVINKYGSTNYERVEYIHDLRCIIAQIENRPQPNHNLTSSSLYCTAKEQRFGEWVSFDAGSFRVKIHKSGTAHIEIHKSVATQLNRILAAKYPQAIPPKFRTTEKSKKEFHLSKRMFGYDLASELMDLARKISPKDLRVYIGKDPRKDLVEILSLIGGEISNGMVRFNYNPSDALVKLATICEIPDIKSHQFYPTKQEIAEKMIDLCEIEEHHNLLEPSAGQGGLADFAKKETSHITCVEIAEINCEILKSKGHSVIHIDFLEYECSEKYDRILMNPPFSEGRAELHLKKAYELLKTGGILIACLPASLRNKNIIDGAKIEWSESMRDKFDNTSVSVVLAKITK